MLSAENLIREISQSAVSNASPMGSAAARFYLPPGTRMRCARHVLSSEDIDGALWKHLGLSILGKDHIHLLCVERSGARCLALGPDGWLSALDAYLRQNAAETPTYFVKTIGR